MIKQQRWFLFASFRQTHLKATHSLSVSRVLQLRNVQRGAAALKWLLTAGCKCCWKNEWRIFIINILLLRLQARILVLVERGSSRPLPFSLLFFSLSLFFFICFFFKFTFTLTVLCQNPEVASYQSSSFLKYVTNYWYWQKPQAQKRWRPMSATQSACAAFVLLL